MKKHLVLLSIFLSWAAFAAPLKTDSESFEPFHSIELKGNFEVTISQGSQSEFTLGEDSNLEAWVEDGILHVQAKGKAKMFSSEDGEIHIQVNELRYLSSSGAIELESEGRIKGDKMKLEFAGASEVELDLEVQSLRVETAGASEITLRGSATYADFKSSGASEFDANGLKVRSLGIETAGASEMEVYVTDELKVKSRGASEITYRGNPPHVIKDMKGASSLESI